MLCVKWLSLCGKNAYLSHITQLADQKQVRHIVENMNYEKTIIILMGEI